MITNHRMDLRFKLLLRSMEAAASSFRGQNGIKDMVTNLLTGDNLRPFLIVMGLFLLYPISGLYNIAFFAVSLFQDLELGGAETVAVFTALLRVAGTLCSTLLLFRWGGVHPEQCCVVLHRFHNRFSQSRRRPLKGPSPG